MSTRVLPARQGSPHPAQGRILQILASKNVHRHRHRLAIRAHRAHDRPLRAGQPDLNIQPAPRVPSPLSPKHGVGHAHIPRITRAAKPQRHLAPADGAGPGLRSGPDDIACRMYSVIPAARATNLTMVFHCNSTTRQSISTPEGQPPYYVYPQLVPLLCLHSLGCCRRAPRPMQRLATKRRPAPPGMQPTGDRADLRRRPAGADHALLRRHRAAVAGIGDWCQTPIGGCQIGIQAALGPANARAQPAWSMAG
jgi:hypothetical protein